MNRLWVLAVLTLVIFSCRGDLSLGPTPEDFTKVYREQLGSRIAGFVNKNRQSYPIIPRAGKFLEPYQYLEQLYRQATLSIRTDLDQSSTNSWDETRMWNVTILNDDTEMAYTFPGGDFYISRGFLRRIKHESELYHVMILESLIMEEGILLNKLIDEFKTTPLFEVAKTGRSTHISIEKIAHSAAHMRYQLEDILPIIPLSKSQICNSSLYDPENIFFFLSNNVVSPWVSYRSIPTKNVFPLSEETICGTLISNGSYGKIVKPNL